MAVMALERVPSDIRKYGGVARMSDPKLIEEIKARGQHPGHGQVPHRPLRRGADPRGARGRLHRRVGGPHPGRRGAPHRQAPLQGAVRLRLPRPRRGAAPHRRGRGDDPHQGRGRHRRHRRGGTPHARRAEGDSPAPRPCAPTSCSRRPRSCARRSTSCSRPPSSARCRSRTSRAGGVATPADASLMRQLGAEAVFVGSGIFKSENPERVARAIVQGHHPLRQAGDPGRGEHRPRRADARARARARSRRRSGSPSAAGRGGPMTDDRRAGQRHGSACSRCRATSREHVRGDSRDRRRAGRGAAATRPRRPGRADPARRREHDDAHAHRRVRPARADPVAGPRRRTDPSAPAPA